MTTTDSPSVLQDKDIDRLVNAQKKPQEEPTMKDKALLFEKQRQEKKMKHTEAKMETNPLTSAKTFRKAPTEASTATTKDSTKNVNNATSTKNNTKNTPKNTPKNIPKNTTAKPPIPKSAMKPSVPAAAATVSTSAATAPAATASVSVSEPAAAFSPASHDMASFMTGDTSAAIECLMNGTSTSTPQKSASGISTNKHVNAAASQVNNRSNTSNSFDSHTTQKAGSYNPNITNILSERELDSTDCYADSESRSQPHKPSVLLPTTVLTDNKTPTYPPSPEFFSDHTDARDVRVGASFVNHKQPYNFARNNHGSDVSSAMDNARRQASETRRSNLSSYNDRNQPAAHSYLRTAPNHMEKIRTEVDKEQTREKKLARERLARKQQRDKFDLLQTPQTKNKFNMQVPLDMSEEQLFEVICKLTTQLDQSQARVREVEELVQQCSEQLNERSVEIDSLKSQYEEDQGEKEMLVGQLEEQLKRVSEEKDVELRQATERMEKELNHVTATKDHEIQQLKQQVQDLTIQLSGATVSDVKTLRTDYEHYKSQCYRKDVMISELEARLQREENLEKFETELKDKEKRLIKTELRLGQQALEQDHERQKLEVEKKVLGEKDEEERLRERLRELGSRDRSYNRSSRDRSHDRLYERSPRSRDRSSRDRSRDRYSRSRSRSRYRRRSDSVKDYSVGPRDKGDLRSLALEKIIDFLLARQKAGAQRAHMDACYNVSGPGVRYGDGLSDATVEKVLKEFLNKDEGYLMDLLEGDGKRLDEYLGTIYSGVGV